MDVANQFKEIGIFLTHNRFIAILKQMPAPFMALVEGDGIAGHEATHDLAQRGCADAQKKMEVIGNKRPSIALGLSLIEYGRKAVEERPSILIVCKYFSSFNSSGYDVLQKAGGVKSWLTRHYYPY